MIIRVQTTEGTKRLEIKPSETTKQLYEKAHNEFGLKTNNFSIFMDRNRKEEIVSSPRKTLTACKLKHGDMVYLFMVGVKLTTTQESVATEEAQSESNQQDRDKCVLQDRDKQQVASHTKSQVKEDEVDILLAKEEGKLKRKVNPTMCHHNSQSMCVHCTALDPWDEGYLKENNIKHLSFHSHLRQLTSGIDKGKYVSLHEESCKIDPNCKEHPPWPKGICSKCQPSALTLNRQVYRHVDNVMFENKHIVERFLNYWRVTGHQRVGFLYGKYTVFKDVPLGIQTVVTAIYEPPQEGSRDHVKILPDPKKEIIDEVARGLGLTCVGWIFTDLVPLDASAGTVKQNRGGDAHLVSAHEVITAAHLQNQHPNPSKHASLGYYGSKFATVIVTGDKDNQVHMEGYQVSNQSMVLVRDGCLLPTKDAPELAYVRESSPQQYVPDVFFKEKDEYGNEVTRLGRPLPVEYLLLDVPVSTPVEPQFTFAHNSETFPVSNRLVEGHLQDFGALSKYLNHFTNNTFLEAMSDFHLLAFIATMDIMPMREYLKPLLTAVSSRDREAALEWRKSEQWATVEQLISASGGDSMATSSMNTGAMGALGGAVAGGSGASSWTCSHCTFVNATASENCEMCNLPHQ
ncbi:unnamed protein product, partial [Meganyctiphanes norvegica]